MHAAAKGLNTNMEQKIEVISKEFIKPISPTPNHLKSYEFSILDQCSTSGHGPTLLYYPPPPLINQKLSEINTSRSKHLKKSLSQNLARYYHLAGRLQNNISVDCNDEGVLFLEAIVHNQTLEDILKNPYGKKHFEPFLPITFEESFSSNLLLLIQVTFFECGGMAVWISATHKMLDAASFITFMNDWITLSRHDDPNGPNLVLPQLVPIAQFLPPAKELQSVPSGQDILAALSKKPCVTNIYVFSPSSIANLKTKAASENIPIPSRVEVVTSFIWKYLTTCSKRPSMLIHQVNMRKRVNPPLHAHCIGNFIGTFGAFKHESEKELANMVASLRKGLDEFDNKYVKRLMGSETMTATLELLDYARNLHSRKDVDIFRFNSWCGYSFYDVDFGWGKPILFNTLIAPMENWIMLMDTKDGKGVEARVTLNEEDMKMFEQNQELSTYATLMARIHT